MNKLVYTFFSYNKKTSKALYEATLPDWDKKYINGLNLNPLLKVIPEYDIIIGIADHNKNAKDIRFDPVYVNKRGRRTLVNGGAPELMSNLEFNYPDKTYTFSSATNGPCNRSAYYIMKKIEDEHLSTQFAFFHIPKWITAEKLEAFLEQIV